MPGVSAHYSVAIVIDDYDNDKKMIILGKVFS